MKLSKRCEYGLKAIVRLAQAHDSTYVQSRKMAEEENLPAKFLESILLSLRSASLLESKVGAGGGYRLSMPAEQIRLDDVLSALDNHAERAEPDEQPLETAGRHAVDEVHHRIEHALKKAVGQLTVADLVELAHKRANGAGSTMYYI